MTIRSDVAVLLHEGLPNHIIGRRLHISPTRVQDMRRALGIPNLLSVPPAPSIEALFHERTEAQPGGHLIWVGEITPTGQLKVGWKGRSHSPHKVAFRIRTGRDPIGRARTSCDMRHCVAPAHVSDRAERDRDNAAFNALFGGAL
ncbi:hypothetical protein [Streptomyces xanthophaeus]|uniref:hypothetical protein n=1 Tax=Streptomyces xanthophaeus TaxID=67385 RepID=UPI002648A1DD|nr:hypothetical protein [Streptomyces xanthophaeus]WKD36552.1 hypothetical protein KO717_34540 [Streptomyces xanthophaeus]